MQSMDYKKQIKELNEKIDELQFKNKEFIKVNKSLKDRNE